MAIIDSRWGEIKSRQRLASFGAGGAAARAAVATDQFAALHIERVALHDLPLMKAALAEGLALVLLPGAGTFEGDDISHAALPGLVFWRTYDENFTYNSVPKVTREPSWMEITIAACGWLGPEWDHFYPDDLPAEWRLDYYANEFLAVMVPYVEWSVAADEVLLAWPQKVADDFRFFWELPPEAVAACARLQRLRGEDEFAAHWGGVVDFAAAPPLSQTPFGHERLALLRLQHNMGLRPLRQAIDGALGQGEAHLLVVVEASAADSLRATRDLALLLGGG